MRKEKIQFILRSLVGLIFVTGCSQTNFAGPGPTAGADQTASCNPSAFGTLCPGTGTPPPTTTANAHGFFYNLTPIADPSGLAAGVGTYANQHVAGSMSLLTSADVIPNLDFYATTIDVPLQVWSAGFPGFTNLTEWFGLCYDASWTAPAAGSYTFVTAVDDAVALWIDGNLIGENDDGNINQATISENTGANYNPGPVAFNSVTLASGQHTVEVMFYQGWPTQIEVQIWVLPPGSNYTTGATPPASELMQLASPINGVLNCPH